LRHNCCLKHLLTSILQKKRQILEATPEERVAQLEVTRADLVLKKNEMERKIANFAERRRAKKEGQTDGK
jgi:hypothetical protein